MPRNNGVASLPPVTWATPGTTIRAQQHNDPMRDIEAMLTNSLPRDGSAPMNGNLPMAGRRITNLGAATQPSDAARLDQIPLSSQWLQSVAALVMEADRLPYATGANTAALTILTSWARSLLDDPDAAAARATLLLGSLATVNPTGTASATTFLRGDMTWQAPIGGIGANQVPTDVVASRVAGQNYTNGTARSIMPTISILGPGTVIVNVGATVGTQFEYCTIGVGSGEVSNTSFVVPPSWTYRISVFSGTPNVINWTEVR